MSDAKSIPQSLFRNVSLVLFTSFLILGYFGISQEYSRFSKESGELREELLDARKTMLQNQVDWAAGYIDYMRSRTEERVRQSIRGRVEEAFSIADHLYRTQSPGLSDAAILNQIRETLRPIRFNQGRGYYFMTALDGMEILFADRPDKEGLNLLQSEDPREAQVIQDMIDLVRERGEGFYAYDWSRPGTEELEFKKISYVKLFPPLQCFIGTGEYMTDMEADIQSEVLARLGNLRFGEEGYLFAGTWEGISLLGPATGQNMIGISDFNGLKIVETLIHQAREGGGFLNYVMPKLEGGERPEPKISYVRGVPDWQWYIGTGAYIDDIEASIAQARQAMLSRVRWNVLKTALILALVLTATYLLGRRMAEKTDRSIQAFQAFFHKAASESAEIRLPDSSYPEFKDLAASANRMVAERKQNEEALRESEMRYRSIFESIQDVYYETGMDGCILEVSPSIEKISRYTRQELLGQNLQPFYAHIEQRTELLNLLLTQGSVVDYEITLRDKDGNLRMASISAQLHRDALGRPEKMCGTIRDISDRKRAEAALQESEARFRSILQNLSDVIWITDRQIRIKYVTPSCLQLLGYRPDEIEGASGFDLVHPDDLAITQKAFSEVLSKENPRQPTEIRIRHADGRWIRIEAIGNNMLDHPHVQGIVLTTRDVTQRRQTEEALRAIFEGTAALTGEAFFRTLAERLARALQVKYSMVGELIESERMRTLAFWNGDAFEPDYEFPYADTPCAKTIRNSSCFHPQAVQEVFPDSLMLKRLGAESYRGIGLRDTEGKTIGLLAVLDILPMQEDPIAENLLQVFAARASAELSRQQAERDRERMEIQLRQAQKMEAVGQLAGGVAHDFNNLLQAIQGYTDLVLADLSPEDLHREELEQVKSAAQRAADLTRQLLTFSRRQVIAPVDLDLNEVAGNLMKMIRRVIGEHIQLEFIPGYGLRTIYADRGQIEQVLMNLCVNARDAMPEGGKIAIATGNTALDPSFRATHPEAKIGPHVALCVSDTGCGMDPAMLSHIFEPFFTTKDPGKGTGLGLATVYGIVRQHDGLIEVESQEGIGSQFKIYLPSVDREAVPISHPAPLSGPPGRETILLAEDDEAVRQLGKRILENAGYRVLTAGDGEEALGLFERFQDSIDLMLLDVVMPKLGGRALMDRIQSRCARMKFIFASGYSEQALHTGFVLNSGIDLIKKPYRAEELLKRVREVIER